MDGRDGFVRWYLSPEVITQFKSEIDLSSAVELTVDPPNNVTIWLDGIPFWCSDINVTTMTHMAGLWLNVRVTGPAWSRWQ